VPAGSIFTIIERYEELPNIDTDIDTKKNNLIIFDDVINEGIKSQKMMKEYFTRGRTKNISCIMISQSFFDIPLLIRKNCNYIILKNIAQITDLSRIAREFAFKITPDKIIALYEYAISKPNGFFMIDTQNEHLRFRSNFTPIPAK
jgi:hypothetical protein